jgi:hypothetical protein
MQIVPPALAAADIRHRFELYNVTKCRLGRAIRLRLPLIGPPVDTVLRLPRSFPTVFERPN